MYYMVMERRIPSVDGIHTVYGKIYIPIGTPKATIQIIHGMSEHVERYHAFMSFMAEKGFVVFMHDQLGHGKTVENNDSLGFIAEENGDVLLVEDAKNYANQFLEVYRNVPHIVFGHSMGSFVARLYSEEYPENSDMMILSGTGGPKRLAPLGLAITDISGKIRGAEYKSNVFRRLVSNVYNYRFKDEDCEYAWISSNKENIEDYESDTKCNFQFSVKSLNDVVQLSMRCNSDEWFENYRKDLPLLIISGEQDPVGENGRGVLEVYKRLKENNAEDVTFKLYRGCRHDILNELNKDEVMNDILVWIMNRLNKQSEDEA